MKVTMTFLILASFTVKAEVTHEHVGSMLDQMVRENVISQVEADKAKIRMKTLSPEHWTAMNKKAAVIASRSPASIVPSHNQIEEVHQIDLDGAQFKQIQSEVQKIMPGFRDQK